MIAFGAPAAASVSRSNDVQLNAPSPDGPHPWTAPTGARGNVALWSLVGVPSRNDAWT